MGACWELARHQGVAVRTGASGARLPNHVGQAVGGEGVQHLAGHQGGPADGVGGVAHAQVVVRDDELGSNAWLKEDTGTKG